MEIFTSSIYLVHESGMKHKAPQNRENAILSSPEFLKTPRDKREDWIRKIAETGVLPKNRDLLEFVFHFFSEKKAKEILMLPQCEFLLDKARLNSQAKKTYPQFLVSLNLTTTKKYRYYVDSFLKTASISEWRAYYLKKTNEVTSIASEDTKVKQGKKDFSREDEMIIDIDPGTASDEFIAELLKDLSMVYRTMGGSGLNFSLEGTYQIEEKANV